MEPGYFTSRQFLVAAAVAAFLVAGAAAAWSFGAGEGGIVLDARACQAPAHLGTQIPTTPRVERDEDGERVVASYDVDAGEAVGGSVHVCTAVGEVLVEPSPDALAHLQVRVAGEPDAVAATSYGTWFGRHDGTLVLQAWVERQASSGSFWGMRNGAEAVIVLQVPMTGAYDVVALADVGDARVGALLVRELRVETAVGEARATGVDLTGNATISSDVGRAVLSAASVQTGTISVASDVDDVEVELPRRADVGYDVTASADVGDVDVEVGDTELDERDSDGPSASAHVRTAGYASKPTQVRVVATADVGSVRVVASE